MACAGMFYLGSLGVRLDISEPPLSLIMLLSYNISCVLYCYRRVKLIPIIHSIT